jgi:23S rRNA (adenine2503-C2)-methyltransferase
VLATATSVDEPGAPSFPTPTRLRPAADAVLRSRAMPSRARPDLAPLLASQGVSSLARLLEGAGGSPTAAASAAARVVAYAFGRDAVKLDAVAWDRDAIVKLQIGAWAHEALLALDARPSLAIDTIAPASDGTERLLLRARDGALLETVVIPVSRGAARLAPSGTSAPDDSASRGRQAPAVPGPARVTLCISSQVGCARACTFCETGAHGLARQLDAGEIVDQVRIARARQAELGRDPITNIVFMGMGEPFDNLGEVSRAIELLTDGRAFRLAPSRVTVSTVGVADKLEAFFATCNCGLAVSLNAPDDARRSAIMPVNDRFPMATLRAALVKHLPPSRHVLFEYVLIAGFNDAVADADLVADYVRDIRCRVNVIPLNPGPDPRQLPPTTEVLDAFIVRLAERGVVPLVRRPRGQDVGGACGQLAGAARRKKENETREPVASSRPDE